MGSDIGQLEELSPCVCSAQCGRNRSLRARGIVELVVPAIGVGLQNAGEGLKMLHDRKHEHPARFAALFRLAPERSSLARIRECRQAALRDTPCARRTAAGWKSHVGAPSPMPAGDPKSSPPLSAAFLPPTISRRLMWRVSATSSIPTISYRMANSTRRPTSDEYVLPTCTSTNFRVQSRGLGLPLRALSGLSEDEKPQCARGNRKSKKNGIATCHNDEQAHRGCHESHLGGVRGTR